MTHRHGANFFRSVSNIEPEWWVGAESTPNS
jgi:hypothetical protein